MAGYSGTPLVKKLGIKPGSSLYILNMPQEYLKFHLFVKKNETFQQWFVKSKKHLKKDGMLWISWPKKSSKVPTDLDENIIREFGLEEGLVDVKVCAVDESWSGLKFVFRMKDR
jgi:hypothetical protein